MFHCNEAKVLVIIGSNGSGKSLLNLIAEIIPDEGRSRLTARTSRQNRFQSSGLQECSGSVERNASDLTILDNFRLATLRTKRKGFRIGINQQFRKFVRGFLFEPGA
jgi:putative ABC transport system ATP-binding protein